MRIWIKANHTHFFLPIPLWLAVNPLTRFALSTGVAAKISTKLSEKIGVEIPPAAIWGFLNEFNKTARRFRGFTLVDIRNADGSVVKITL